MHSSRFSEQNLASSPAWVVFPDPSIPSIATNAPTVPVPFIPDSINLAECMSKQVHLMDISALSRPLVTTGRDAALQPFRGRPGLPDLIDIRGHNSFLCCTYQGPSRST